MAPCAPVAQSAMRRPTLGGRRLPSGRAALPYRRLGHKIISPGCSYDARFCHPGEKPGSTYRGKRPSRFDGGTRGNENPPPRMLPSGLLARPDYATAQSHLTAADNSTQYYYRNSPHKDSYLYSRRQDLTSGFLMNHGVASYQKHGRMLHIASTPYLGYP